MHADAGLMNDPAKDDLLILVDGLDRETGTATKAQAHLEGLLHRAFSVVLVRQGDGGPQLLLTRRAQGKYHSAGLWTNSCCSHPRAGEQLLDAAYRRVREELGCEATELHEIGAFVYRAEFANGLVEYEYDHVLIGGFEGELDVDPSESDAIRWISCDEFAKELAGAPETITAWAFTVFSIAMRALSSEAEWNHGGAH